MVHEAGEDQTSILYTTRTIIREGRDTDASCLPNSIDVLRVFIDIPQRDRRTRGRGKATSVGLLPQDSVNGRVDDRVCPHLVALRS